MLGLVEVTQTSFTRVDEAELEEREEELVVIREVLLVELEVVVVLGENEGGGVVLELPPSLQSGEVVVSPAAPSEEVTELLEPSVSNTGISVKGNTSNKLCDTDLRKRQKL